jgi:hypothetical protein
MDPTFAPSSSSFGMTPSTAPPPPSSSCEQWRRSSTRKKKTNNKNGRCCCPNRTSSSHSSPTTTTAAAAASEAEAASTSATTAAAEVVPTSATTTSTTAAAAVTSSLAQQQKRWTTTQPPKTTKPTKSVRFGTVSVRVYAITAGARTACPGPCPIQLDWQYSPAVTALLLPAADVPLPRSDGNPGAAGGRMRSIGAAPDSSSSRPSVRKMTLCERIQRLASVEQQQLGDDDDGGGSDSSSHATTLRPIQFLEEQQRRTQ